LAPLEEVSGKVKASQQRMCSVMMVIDEIIRVS